MEALLLLLKLLGLVIASGLGVLGTIKDYRDKATGRLTKWGRFAVFSLVGSALVAVGAQVVEESLRAKSTREAALQAAASAARSEQMVVELARVLQPLEFTSIHISGIQFRLDDSKFRVLKANIETVFSKHLKQYEMNAVPLGQKHISIPSQDCRQRNNPCSPLSIEIAGAHEVFPKSGLERALFHVGDVSLSIYRKPIDPARFEHRVIGGDNDGDLNLRFGSMFGLEPLSIEKELKTGSYKLTGSFFSIHDLRDTTGLVRSVPDLAGSQFFLHLPINALPDDLSSMTFGMALPEFERVKRSDVLAFQKQFELGAVAIHIGARTLWVPKAGWRKHVTGTAVYWEYIVPNEPFTFGPDGPR